MGGKYRKIDRKKVMLEQVLGVMLQRNWKRELIKQLCREKEAQTIKQIREKVSAPTSSLKYTLSRLEQLGFLTSAWTAVEKSGRYYWIKLYSVAEKELCEKLFPQPQTPTPRRKIKVSVDYKKIECLEIIGYSSRYIECPQWVLEDPEVIKYKSDSERIKRETGYTFVFTKVFYEY